MWRFSLWKVEYVTFFQKLRRYAAFLKFVFMFRKCGIKTNEKKKM